MGLVTPFSDMLECEGPFCEANSPNVRLYQHYDTEEILCEICAMMQDETLRTFRVLRRQTRH